MLAALLARVGQPVPIDTLVAAVWNEDPPASARHSLQLHVHQLRRALAWADHCQVTIKGGNAMAAPESVDPAGFVRE